jgi:putative ABC transport system permease protein
MLYLAFRNLFQNKIRLVVSVGGVALALLLILALDAILQGMTARITAYIDHSGSDIFISQSGVKNMHMASSTLPASIVSEVQAVPGTASVTPILYQGAVITLGEARSSAYVIGLPPDAMAGGPWKVTAGVRIPEAGQAIIDRGIAEKAGMGLESTVKILGRNFKIAGLSEETAGLGFFVAFISFSDFAQLRGNTQTVSYVLVKVMPGESPEVVASRIERDIVGVTAQTRQAFSDQERKVINDMSTDILAIMNLVGFLIGLAVMALTVYTATLARRAEYGMLKALGARNGHLYRAVLAQAFGSITLGFALGLAITLVLSVIVPRLGLDVELQVSGASLLKVGIVSLIIAGASAILPIKQVAGLDPAMVFRGGKVK